LIRNSQIINHFSFIQIPYNLYPYHPIDGPGKNRFYPRLPSKPNHSCKFRRRPPLLDDFEQEWHLYAAQLQLYAVPGRTQPSRTCGNRDTLKKWGGTNLVYGLAGSSNFQPNPARAGLARVQVSPADPESRGTERSSRICGIWRTLLYQRQYVPLTQCTACSRSLALHKRLYPVSVCEKVVLLAVSVRRGVSQRQTIRNRRPFAPGSFLLFHRIAEQADKIRIRYCLVSLNFNIKV